MEDRGEEVEGGSVEEKVLVGEAGGLVRQVRREGGGTGRREEEGELPRWRGREAERWVRWRRRGRVERRRVGRRRKRRRMATEKGVWCGPRRRLQRAAPSGGSIGGGGDFSQQANLVNIASTEEQAGDRSAMTQDCAR